MNLNINTVADLYSFEEAGDVFNAYNQVTLTVTLSMLEAISDIVVFSVSVVPIEPAEVLPLIQAIYSDENLPLIPNALPDHTIARATERSCTFTADEEVFRIRFEC